jgi:outer membrane immunogenic protein
MRHVVVAAVLGLGSFGLASTAAVAADMSGPAPALRGALPASNSIDWNGFYLGGQVGYSQATNSGSESTNNPYLSLLGRGTAFANSVRQPIEIPNGQGNQSNRVSLGVFAGYNIAYEDIVIGFETDYSRGRLDGRRYGSGNIIGTSTTGSNTRVYSALATTERQYKLSDMGTIRGRVGYVWDNMMPYATVGIAWARASGSGNAFIDSNTIAFDEYNSQGDLVRAGVADPGYVSPNEYPARQRAKFHFGYALGAGLDFALSSNIFVRAEVMHTRFTDVGGFGIQINQAKVAAGVKY